MDEFKTKNDFGEDIKHHDASSNEQESERKNFSENIRKKKNATDTCANEVLKDSKSKNKVATKPHEKRVACSQL